MPIRKSGLVRRTATAPKTAAAGVMLEALLHGIQATDGYIQQERAPSRSFGSWSLPPLSKQGDYRWAVVRGGCERTRLGTSVQLEPSGPRAIVPIWQSK